MTQKNFLIYIFAVLTIFLLCDIIYISLRKPIVRQSPTVTLPKKIWGAYTGNTTESFTDFQKLVGKKADLNAVFVGWPDPFPASIAIPLKNGGRTPVIFWESYGVTLDQIIAGQEDYYIKQFAEDAKNYGGNVILAPFHEMNGDWSPWNGTVGNNTPSKVIEAWKRMYNLFSGVSNVKFAWAVNNDSAPNTAENAITNYYPGADYVDYVGVDGFNFGDPWQTYSEIFSKTLEQLKTYNKPIYIFSMASAEGPQKAEWITDTLSQIKANPDIAGWIWFNENKEQNWLIDSDPASLQAFQVAVKQ